jgi:hypothetical protein
MIYPGDSPLTLTESGQVPETRMADAQATQDFVRRLINNDVDGGRSFKRSRVNGLVDGNPPYSDSKLLKANRRDACNANWGTGRTYLEAGAGAFYDLQTEAPSLVAIKLEIGKPEERVLWERAMDSEADRVLASDPVWDWESQQSQNEMVLHGIGPLFFENSWKVLPRFCRAADLKVPEFTRSDTHYWDAAVILAEYYPPQIYEFIKDQEEATASGWDVEYTKLVIARAVDIKQQLGVQYDWEFLQQELKNNSLSLYDSSKVVRLAYVFVKEFDGRITQSVVERDSYSGSPAKYMFHHIGRYRSWGEAIHPMYYDRGNGGMHHSVTGLGVKMYKALEYENRLFCNQMDKAFAPKLIFKPSSVEATSRFQLTTYSDYATVSPGYDAIQNPMAGILNDGLSMFQAGRNLLMSNLSGYRQPLASSEPGNPPTKYQKQLEAYQQSSLNKTTISRYYKQLDKLYGEIVRRLCDLNNPDNRAVEFQRRCQAKGVPREAFGRVESAGAVRVIGQGSAFLRKEAVDALVPLLGSFPEDGQRNLLNDKIAAEAGRGAVDRYNPQRKMMASDQEERAMDQVAGMKLGLPPVITSSQNPVTFAGVFLRSAVQAAQSLQQGADPAEVSTFLHVAGPAVMAHLQRFRTDLLRKPIWDVMERQWKQLSQMAQKIDGLVAAQRQHAERNGQRAAQVSTDENLKAAQVRSKLLLNAAKTRQQIELRSARHQQDMQLADAKTAADIRRSNLRTIRA